MFAVSFFVIIGGFVWLNSQFVHTAYSPATETEIRNRVVLNTSHDPVSRPEAQTHIKIGLSVFAIDELNLRDQKLMLAGWLTFEWNDKRLRWNRTENDDLKYIFVKPEHIWKPELIVDNSLQDIDIISIDELLLRLRYDGLVDWEPPMLLVTHCEVDITYYPYDTQRCAVELLSWSYTIDEVILDHLFEEVNLEDFQQHGEWHILYTEIQDRNLTEHLPDGTLRVYPQLNFWIILQRRAGFYNLNVMMPIMVTSLMVVLVFLVPLNSGEKISYIITEFLALLVLLTIVVPPTSITVSILGIYLGVVLILAACGILVTVLLMYVFHKEGVPKKNSLIIKVTTCLTRIVCWEMTGDKCPCKAIPKKRFAMGSYNFKDEDCKNGMTGTFSNGTKDETETVHNIKNEAEENKITWKFVATIFDRFCFYLFLLTTVVMNLSFVFALSGGGKSAEH